MALLFSALAQTAIGSQLSNAIADLPLAAQSKITNSVRGFLRYDVSNRRSANDLGWDCLASAALVELNVENAKQRLINTANEIVRSAVESRQTKEPIGWTSAREKSGLCLGDAENICSGDRTVYAFQSGLGIACLAKAGQLLKKQEFTEIAEKVMGYWSNLLRPKAPCGDCSYFASSDSARHAERYVRNMNIFMAFGAQELARSNGNSELGLLAAKAAASDIAERTQGNRGYLGRHDPLWISRASEAERIENHSAAMATLLLWMARQNRDQNLERHAVAVYRDWATCKNERCQKAGCHYWAGEPAMCQATQTAAHCAFRLSDELAKQQCISLLNHISTLNSFGLWSVLIPHVLGIARAQ